MPEALKLTGIPLKISKNPPNKHSNGPYITQEKTSGETFT